MANAYGCQHEKKAWRPRKKCEMALVFWHPDGRPCWRRMENQLKKPCPVCDDRGSKEKATNKCQRPSTTAVRLQHQLKRGASLRKRPTRSSKGAMGRPWQPGHLQNKACVGGRHAHFPAAEQWPRPAKVAEPLHCCSVQCGQHGERQVSARCSWQQGPNLRHRLQQPRAQTAGPVLHRATL